MNLMLLSCREHVVGTIRIEEGVWFRARDASEDACSDDMFTEHQ